MLHHGNFVFLGATSFKVKLLSNLAPRPSRRSKVEIDEQHAAHSKMYPVSDTRPDFGSLVLGGPRVGSAPWSRNNLTNASSFKTQLRVHKCQGQT
jgi:hypothetical protein